MAEVTDHFGGSLTIQTASNGWSGLVRNFNWLNRVSPRAISLVRMALSWRFIASGLSHLTSKPNEDWRDW